MVRAVDIPILPNDLEALDLLKNASIAAGGVLPMCQDTGTAIIKGKKGQLVFTGGGDEAAIARGVYDTYLSSNLRYSQLAPVTMYEEKNTGTNLPAEIEINASGTDMFGEDLAAKIGELERNGTPNARHVITRLRGSQAIVTLHVLDSALDPDVAWEMLSPVWTVLPAISPGLTQSDGQGFYDGSQLVVALG